MDQNLRVPILPPVKLLIRFWCLVNTDLVRDDKRGFGAAGDDHVAQVSIVLLYIALACADCESLTLSLAYLFPLPVPTFSASIPWKWKQNRPSQTVSRTRSKASPSQNSHPVLLDQRAHTAPEHRYHPLVE